MSFNTFFKPISGKNSSAGQTSWEYILLIVIVAGIVFKFKSDDQKKMAALELAAFGCPYTNDICDYESLGIQKFPKYRNRKIASYEIKKEDAHFKFKKGYREHIEVVPLAVRHVGLLKKEKDLDIQIKYGVTSDNTEIYQASWSIRSRLISIIMKNIRPVGKRQTRGERFEEGQ